MRHSTLVSAFAISLVLAGCTGHQQTDTTASPSPAAATSSPEAAGDYATGPNHVLPTSGAARVRGGLSSADFVKVISVQELTPRALRELAPAITTLARAEGLEAHARSVEVRLG